MATYTYKNINIEVSHLNYVDHTGETYLKLHSSLIAELIENSCTFNEFFLYYEQEELFNELDRDTEAVAEHYKNLDEEIEISNANAIIGVYEYCLENEDKTFNFEATTENISWVIHDVLHSVHDVAGCTINVAYMIEEERILKSLEITKEQFPHMMPDYMFLENLENEFYSRFKMHLDLDNFKYMEYEY